MPEHALPSRLSLVLSGIAALAAFIAAGTGLAFPSFYDGAGPETLRPGLYSQDIVTIAVALWLLGTLRAIRRGSLRAWMPWLGLNGYLIYGYVLVSVDRVYVPTYPLFLVIAGSAAYAVIFFFGLVDTAPIAGRVQPGAPRRAAAGVLSGLALLFAALWLSMLLPALARHSPPDGNTIFVLDLSFVLPLLAITAGALLTRRPLGDLLAVPLLIKAGTLGLSVLIGSLMAPLFGGRVAWSEVAIYGAMAVIPLGMALWFWSCVAAGSGPKN